ncbi:hypothetical protein [Archaeoglobus veneficus]|uniref:Uncharacterized protein n=1 Tax=Archaeoglobus veneficus (strain DSM 11195 / SNP6) TaxID=693661 RepID=F2KNG4_ARCVS|nr:hypothetical protein [Archaeoglobus veneficus]AEA47366.1 hypothetical protein Arcve_1362 [Archaeoglobus veneficus SNP6]
MDVNLVVQAINISLTPVIIIACFYVYRKTKHRVPLIVGVAFLTNFALTNTVSLVVFQLMKKGIMDLRSTFILLHVIYTTIKAIFTALLIYAMLLFLRSDREA